MPDLFRHVGQGKAGSSAIQSFFAANFELLSQFGIMYPNPLIAGKLPGAVHNGNAYGDRWDAVDKVICKGTVAFPGDNLLFSNEWIFLDLYHDPKRLEKLLDKISPQFNVRVILYIRDITDHFLSEYVQGIQDRGISCSPMEFLLGAGSVSYCSPYAVLHCIRQVKALGIDLIVRKYRTRGLVEDFVALLLENRRDEFMASVRTSSATINRSLTRAEMELLKQFNRLDVSINSFTRPLAYALIGQTPEIAGEKPYASEGLVRGLEKFADTVAEINAHIDPQHRLSTDFSIPENRPNFPDNGTYTFNKRQLEIIAHAVSEAHGKAHNPTTPKRLLMRAVAGCGRTLRTLSSLAQNGLKALAKKMNFAVKVIIYQTALAVSPVRRSVQRISQQDD